MSNKILIIEDEPDIRKTIEYNLSREGFKIFACDIRRSFINVKC